MGSAGNTLLGFADVVTRLRRIKESNETARRGQDIRSRDRNRGYDITERQGDENIDIRKRQVSDTEKRTKALYGPGGIERGRLKVMQQNADTSRDRTKIEQQRANTYSASQRLSQARFDAEQRTQKAQFEEHMSGQPDQARLMMLGKAMPEIEPAITDVMQQVGAGNIKDRWDAYHYLKAKESTILFQARESLMKEIERLNKEGKSVEAEQKAQQLNAMVPGVIEGFFGFPESMMPTRPNVDMTGAGRLQINQTKANKAGQDDGLFDPYDRNLQKQVADAEEKIIANADNEAAQGQIDFFNQYAAKPYMYMFQTREGGITDFWQDQTEATKIQLPIINGKQALAHEVYYTARQEGMTLDEVLRAIGALDQ